MAYLKPQTPLKDLNSGDYFYPLTTIDLIITGDSRLSTYFNYVNVTVSTSNWSSSTVNNLGDNKNYYYYTINLTSIYAEIPRIELAASGSNTIPTENEVKAFTCISKPKGWAVCDTDAKTITLYALVKPTSNFVIKIQGVTI